MGFRLARGEIGHLLREAGNRPLRFLLRRAKDDLLGRLHRSLATLGWNPYRARLRPRDPGSPPIVPPDGLDRGISRWHEERPDQAERLLRRAARNADREFGIFSVWVRGDPDVDWHRDHVSNESWPVRFHTAYSYADLIDLSRPTDVKVPWELSRLQFLPRLAVAHRLTGETSYVVAAREILDDWDRANPVGYGINWTVGMEVALRAVSIILATDLLAQTGAEREFLDERVIELLGEHGRFLYRNIEYSDVNGNHFTSCLLGLLYLGSRVTVESESRVWRDHALERLESEIQRQVYPDGVCHEGSIPYHGLVTELFLHGLLVARQSGEDFGAPYLERLRRMLQFLRACVKPDGRTPIWGDTDDGRVFSLGGEMDEHHLTILALGTGLLGRSEPWDRGTPVPLEAVLLLGPERSRQLVEKARAPSPPKSSPAKVSSAEPSPEDVSTGGNVGFPEGGFFLLRDRHDYCLVDCGDVGLRGRGGHGHNDVLSMELVIGGRDVLVDTGCSSYTRSLADRVACVGARAHNALVLDGREPAAVATARIPHATACPVEVESWDPHRGLFEGRHFGYEEVAGVGAYVRRVEYLGAGEGLWVRDRLDGSGRHTAAWHFHLAEDWKEPEVLDDRVSFSSREPDPVLDDRRLQVHWKVPSSAVIVVESPVYPSYGCRRERLCLVVHAEVTLPLDAEFRFELVSSDGRVSA